MNKYLKVVLFAFLTWVVAFVVSFVIFPLRISQRPFFETIMAVTVAATAVMFSILYLRRIERGFLREGVLIGVAWFVVNVVIDLFLFMPDSPMHMSFADYWMDIGLTYLIYPVVTLGFGYLLEQKGAARG